MGGLANGRPSRRVEGDRGAVPGAGAHDERSANPRRAAHHGAKALRARQYAARRLRGGPARLQRPADAAAFTHAACRFPDAATAANPAEESEIDPSLSFGAGPIASQEVIRKRTNARRLDC